MIEFKYQNRKEVLMKEVTRYKNRDEHTVHRQMDSRRK